MKKAKPRFQEVKYDMKGNPFVTYYGTRYHLNEFMRSDSQEHDGVYGLTNTSALVIKFSPCNESAKVWMI